MIFATDPRDIESVIGLVPMEHPNKEQLQEKEVDRTHEMLSDIRTFM